MRLAVVRRHHHKVILTSASRGRMAALHKHRSKRVRKKYAHAVVFLRSMMTKDALSEKFHVEGIPRVIVLSGADGSIVNDDARAVITSKKALAL